MSFFRFFSQQSLLNTAVEFTHGFYAKPVYNAQSAATLAFRFQHQKYNSLPGVTGLRFWESFLNVATPADLTPDQLGGAWHHAVVRGVVKSLNAILKSEMKLKI